MDVTIEQRPALRAAGLRPVGPYDQISEAFGRLGQIAGRAGLFAQPGAAMIAIYHDNPQSTPAAELRSDAAVVVAEDVKLPLELTEQRVDGGRYACTIHVGPYEKLPETWAMLMRQWLPANKLRMADGPSYELYLNNPMQVPPEQLRTQICIPLA
jgi:AraC family transcriptional regulator